MEKPKRCGLCPCFHAENPMHCQAVKASKGKRIVAPYGAPIPDWCPLIEIPTPHGRLGDLDKLNIHDISPVDGFCVMGVTEEDIELADTVIEAEGET
jgi:hypothetical protein